MIDPIKIVIPPGSRFIAKLVMSDSTEHIIVDIETPKYEINDDGTVSDKPNDLEWIVNLTAMLFSSSRKRFIYRNEK